ncbi:nucleolar protein 58-like [Xenia sp. Carnegie-2017]|uniref:nucleolar protein 58-like n=1 Tax=Xenia sp. Carnegie-2017 TaxID=2897299 RepID=UPI001F047642|nr:nucleolar protein 58-like [Xenia sp. Carnegie-2017]
MLPDIREEIGKNKNTAETTGQTNKKILNELEKRLLKAKLAFTELEKIDRKFKNEEQELKKNKKALWERPWKVFSNNTDARKIEAKLVAVQTEREIHKQEGTKNATETKNETEDTKKAKQKEEQHKDEQRETEQREEEQEEKELGEREKEEKEQREKEEQQKEERETEQKKE